MRELIQRAWRFVAIGLVCTLVSYVVFSGLMRTGQHFLVANAFAWAAGVGFGFVLNRRYTFRVRGSENLARQIALFGAGSLLQLAISSISYTVLFEALHLPVDLAFVMNLAITSSFMFLYMNLIAFRTPGRAGPPGLRPADAAAA